MSTPLVALAMPHRNGVVHADAQRAFDRPTSRGLRRLELSRGHSLLTFNFNLLWCDALNAREKHGVTHFAMIHDDVCPEPGWLDVLLDELERTGADLISAVVPIKDGRGLTSTAVGWPDNHWMPRRLTVHEACRLPDTFGIEDVPFAEPGQQLLCNTGLWVCRFDAGWTEQVCFRQQDAIVVEPADDFSARFVAMTIPEDWDFSHQVQSLGGTVRATRKVGLYHGNQQYTNRHAWGDQESDAVYLARQGATV